MISGIYVENLNFVAKIVIGPPYTEKTRVFLLDFFQKILEIFIECNILEISGFLD